MPIFVKRLALVPFLLLLTLPVFADTSRWSLLGPDGGTASALAVDPRSPQIVYAGTRQGEGVFKSLDGGATWSRSGAGIPKDEPNGVVALVIDPRRTATLYAGTSNFGVYKSTDGGASWSPVRQGMGTVASVWSLAMDPATSGVVYAGSDAGLFKTTDGGAHWRSKTAGLPPSPLVRALAIDPRRPQVLYAAILAAGAAGVYKSTNGGETWVARNQGLPAGEPAATLAVDPRRSATVYAATYGGLYKSANGGASWTSANAGLPQSIVSALAIDPQNPQILFAGTFFGDGMFRSDDGGASWSPIDDGLTNRVVWALAIDPQGTALYAGTDGGDRFGARSGPGGVFRTTDGRTWRRTVHGLAALTVRVVAAGPGSRPALWAGTEALGLFRSLDGGSSWRQIPGTNGLIDQIVADPSHSGTVYTLGFREESSSQPLTEFLLKTTDSGRTWTSLPLSASGPFYGLKLDPRTGVLWRFSLGLERSADGGLTWTASAGGIARGEVLADLAFDPASPQVLYAGGYLPAASHFDVAHRRLYRSADGGATWARIDAGLPEAGGVRKILASPADPRTLYAADGGALFRSTDAGAHWEPVATAPSQGAITDLLATPDGTLYAATSNTGVYASHDGLSWTAIDDGLASLGINGLALAPAHPDTLYAATTGGGVEVRSNP